MSGKNINQNKSVRLFLVFSLFLSTLFFSSALSAQVIFQDDFEKSTIAKPPSSFHSSSGWAGGKANLIIKDTGTDSGKILQADIEGYGQLESSPFRIEEGKNYKVSATVSSRGTQKISMGLRQKPEPYKMHGSLSTQVFESPRKLELIIRGAKKRNPVHVQFVVRGYTTLFIDDVKVEKLPDNLPPQSSNPADMLLKDPEWPSGNQLANSGFEVDLDGWWLRGKGKVEIREDVFEGRKCLNLQQGLLTSPFTPLPLRRDSLLVIRAKALGPDSKVNLGFGNYVNFAGGSDGNNQSFKIKPEDGWKRLSLSWRPKIPQGQLEPWKPFYAKVSGKNILIDGIELRHIGKDMEPEQAPYKSRSELEFAISTDMPYNVATKGEQVKISVTSSQAAPSCLLRQLDEANNEVKTWKLKLKDHLAEVTVQPENGVWRFTTSPTVSASHKNINPPKIIAGETVLCVVPKMPEVPLKDWHFGSHIRSDREMLKACWKLGWKWTRMHDASPYAKWPAIEKNQGEFALNPEVDSMRGEGHALLGNFDWIPKWAPSQDGKDHKKNRKHLVNMNEETKPFLQEACRNLALMSKGRIEEMEITNEPNLSGMTPEQYLEVLKTAHAGLKAGNPDAYIVGLGGVCPAGTKWMYKCIELGAGKYCDAISFHAYGFVPNSQNKGPEPLIKEVARINKALEKAGTPGKKIYDTESGFIIRSYLTKHNLPLGNAKPEIIAKNIPKAVAAVIASKLDRWFYYAAFNQTHPGEGGAYGVAEPSKIMKMSHQPMAVAISFLEGSKFTGREKAPAGIVKLNFKSKTNKIQMLWSFQGEKEITIPAEIEKIINQWGREIPISPTLKLNDSPIYFIFKENVK